VTEAAVSRATFIDVLRQRASEPERIAFTFLRDGEEDEVSLTYEELDRRARAIAAGLQAHAEQSERTILLFAPGLDFMAAFFGCLYAGLVAVPTYPLTPGRLADPLPGILADADARLVLTSDDLFEIVANRVAAGPSPQPEIVVTDSFLPDGERAWREPDVGPEHVAYLQYTSGSTGLPRGVAVSHANLVHNSAAIEQRFEHDASSVGVIWLPPYHDMGLVGGILQPVYGGFPTTHMSPLAFLKRPARWLEAISRKRATSSGGPNFAFDLCLRQVGPEDRRGLDLSSWKVAFNGADTVRADTLDRFAEVFGPCGFRRSAFYPCYGLAEATLIVTGGRRDDPPRVAALDRDLLTKGIAAPPPDGARRAKRLVGCGTPIPGTDVLVVEPQTRVQLEPGRVGEIWVAGPSVAAGYWTRTAETDATFAGRLASGEGPFLRTGDLGLVLGGELYVTGRLKDVIVVRGRNYHPSDVELSVERAHEAIRPGGVAVFSVEEDDAERVISVQELQAANGVDYAAVATAVRAAVSEDHQLELDTVLLVRRGGVPKTPTGKVRRRACKEAFLVGSLDVLYRDTRHDGVPPSLPAAAARSVEALLVSRIAAHLGVGEDEVDLDRTFADYGLDSVMLVRLAGELGELVGRDVSPVLFFDHPTIDAVSRRLASSDTTADVA
jgi:acyl-CoA synthetase (AMP-forming)/AMP-acid ligase II/acyl carrier protein